MPSREAEQKALNKLKIEAPYIDCPDCGGCGREENLFLCQTCNGVGKVYFQDEPDFVTRVRNWWAKLPPYKRANFVGMAAFVGTLCAIIFLLWLLGLWT
jgi:hypothetical protein